MNVRIPSPLRSYTNNATIVQASGHNVKDVLTDLDRQFPGLCFRVVDEQGQLRKHMRVFVNDEMTRDLDAAVSETDEVTLLQALSGGCWP
jgi:sulfur-carrier protein